MSRASREKRSRERGKKRRQSAGVIDWLISHQTIVSRLYASAVLIGIIETVVFVQDGHRTVAILLTLGMLPVTFGLVWLMVALQITINPLWVPVATRVFMSIFILFAAAAAVAGMVIYPTSPVEVLALGNVAVTGAAGLAWAAHYLYESHGLNRRVSPAEFWAGLWRRAGGPVS